MNYQSKSSRMLLATLSVISAIIALWQFYLFVQFRNSKGILDPQGGSLNLWLAVGAALIACAAGAYVVFSVVNRDKEDVIHITS
ncbi:MAG: hypothetical protein ACRD9R_09870 [Pyrinomonadaceae bacterium]